MIREIGTLINLRTVMRDASGALVNTPVVTLTLTAPDLTVTAPVVTNTAANGLYTASFTPTQAGLYRFTWTASGAVVDVQSDQLTVVATQRALVASLEELKERLRRTSADVTDDVDLRSHLVAATDIVEYFIGGPLAKTSFTEMIYHDGPIFPRNRPLVSVTSLTPYQSLALGTTEFVVDTGLGMITPVAFAWGGLPATLVYVAGWTQIPERIKRAGLEMAWHLWLMRNGTSGRGYPGSDDTTVSALGYAVPLRVVQMLAPDTQVMVA